MKAVSASPLLYKSFRGLTAFIWACCAILSAHGAELQVLHGHVPSVVSSLSPTGSMPAATQLNLAISLPLRNQAALSQLLHDIYDPASPNYHHYLTPKQFTEQFGPTEADYQAVTTFAEVHGLHLTARHSNRMILDVSGSVADVENTLHIKLHTYRHPTENRVFFASDTEPSLDLGIPILHISGLDNYFETRPHLVAKPLVAGQNAAANSGAGPGGTYMGLDFRAAYAPDTTLDGSGQTIGLLEFDGYTASDIAYYENRTGLPGIPLQNVLIDGASGNPSGDGGEVEVSLDIEVALSMATNVSKIIVYEAPNGGSWHDILNRMATDDSARQVSCSWYIPGGVADPVADQIFQEMAAQGQSFLNASGDNDAYTGLISFPGDSPYITQVGGTTLSTTGPQGSWVSEAVWNWGNGIGSGGGISTQYPIPDWQTNISMTANQGSTTMRNTPDVAMTADNVYVRADGADYNVGGTSCAAPLWAGFIALVNQQAAVSEHSPVGFLNPLVDAIGTGADFTGNFHDITTGGNTRPGSPTKFYATIGYDLCTGWGTPAGQNLINALANPEALVITPMAGFNSIGGVGGPFSITTQSLSLTNVGTNTLIWTLANTSLWLNASPASGSLAPGRPAITVTANLNNVASNLAVGTYIATLWFTNQNDQSGQGRQFTLNVISPPTITSQPADQAVLDGAPAAFTVSATGGLPLSYQWQRNNTNLTDGGNISGSTTTNLTISNVSTNDIGSIAVVVTNYAGETVSATASLTITPSPPVITTQPASQTAVAGTTVGFNVAALGDKPFSYQWYFNQTNLLVGATNASLTLADVQLTNAGAYSVLMTNDQGSTISSNALLNVVFVPLITSFNPEIAVAGTNVTITGFNFSSTPGENTVYFGAVRATVNSASATNLVVTVPVGATYAPISVTVNGLTAYANSPFLPVFPSGGALDATSFDGPTNLSGGDNPFRVVIGDLDGDGKPDVVVANVLDGSIWIYRNLSTNGGPITLAPPVVLVDGGGTYNQYGLVLADLSGDGRLDIVTANRSLNQICIFQNFSSPGNLTTNSFGNRINLSVAGTPIGLAVADMDGDGRPDIISANLDSNTVSVLQNISIGGLLTTNSFAAPVSFAVGSGPTAVAIADVDGDGKPDVITSDYNNPSTTVSVLRNISSPGNIAFDADVDFPGLGTGNDIAVSDLDGDGKPELVVASGSSGEAIEIYQNLSTPGSITTNSFAAPVNFSLGGWGNSLSVADLDGDGHPDLVVLTQISSQLCVFKNLMTAPGSITTSSFGPEITFASGSNPNGLAIGDLNGDGRPDLFFNNQDDDTSYIYQNVIPFGPPVIVSQPTNQTVLVGQTAIFNVQATGSLPLNYQWYFNQTNLLAGDTNASLTLTNAQLNQAGDYLVVVTNVFGSITSSNAVLDVIDVLDHFTWNTIPSPRFVNVPFAVSLQARDSGNEIFTNFSGTVNLGATNGILVNPTISANFVQGLWVGSLMVSQSATNLVLSANDGLGHIGLANPITVANLPSLGSVQSGNFLLLFWPVTSTNFVLESSSSLSPANWVPVLTAPLQIGDQNLESIQISPTNGFYRLLFVGQ